MEHLLNSGYGSCISNEYIGHKVYNVSEQKMSYLSGGGRNKIFRRLLLLPSMLMNMNEQPKLSFTFWSWPPQIFILFRFKIFLLQNCVISHRSQSSQ